MTTDSNRATAAMPDEGIPRQRWSKEAEMLESWASPVPASTGREAAEDPVVEANRRLLLDRSNVGLKKYGTSLASAGLSASQFAQHALEEALDLANYLQAIIQNEQTAPVAAPKLDVEAERRIPRESNDKLLALARHWKLDGDWMTCKGCKRSLIASRDGEELNHADGCKFAAQQHPWSQLRALIERRAPSNNSPVGADKESK